ncbi:MAG: hypothetical protein AAF702_31235 [Chloroflexota bacterium]
MGEFSKAQEQTEPLGYLTLIDVYKPFRAVRNVLSRYISIRSASAGAHVDETNGYESTFRFGEAVIGSYLDPSFCTLHYRAKSHHAWNAEQGCLYIKERYDDPREVDRIFGTEYTEWADGKLAYPWQAVTHSNNYSPEYLVEPIMAEYANQHGEYSWLVRNGLPCKAEPCITDFRIHYRTTTEQPEAFASHHSFWAEVRVKHSGGQYGLIRRGGWLDLSPIVSNKPNEFDNEILQPKTFNLLHQPLYEVSQDEARAYALGNSTKHNNFFGFVMLSENKWSSIHPNDLLLFASDCSGSDCDTNGSNTELLIQSVQAEQFSLARRRVLANGTALNSPVQQRTISASGYTDRYGYIVDSCSAVQLDCIPYEIQNMPMLDIQQSGQQITKRPQSNDSLSGHLGLPEKLSGKSF